MTRRTSTILCAGALVFLAACGDTPSPVAAPEGRPSFDGGVLAGSGNRSGEGGVTTSTATIR